MKQVKRYIYEVTYFNESKGKCKMILEATHMANAMVMARRICKRGFILTLVK